MPRHGEGGVEPKDETAELFRNPLGEAPDKSATSGAVEPEAAQVPEAEPAPVAQAQSEAQPPTEVDRGHSLEFHTASLDREVHQRAIDAAEKRLENLTGLINRVWKGTFAREYYRQKYIAEAEATMRREGNRLYYEDGDREAHNRTAEAVIDRVIAASHLDEAELSHGERVERMRGNEAEQAFQKGIKSLIKRYASGDLDAESLREERTRLLTEIQTEHPDLFDGAHMMADNLVSLAEQAKGMVDHEHSLDAIVEGIQFYHDTARSGARTEMHRNLADRVIERLQGSKVGAMVNETTIATAVSVAFSVSGVLGRRTAGAVAATVLPGVMAGAFAGLRENTAYKQDRTKHMRDRAEGKEFDPDSSRRATMERTRYETKSAQEIISSLESGGEMNAQQVQSLLAAFSEAKARKDISDIRDVDLISFSSAEGMEVERLALTVKMAEAQAALKAWYESASDEDRRAFSPAESFKEAIRQQSEVQAIALSSEIKEKDRTFKLLKARAVASSAAKGALTGVGIGIVGQELSAILNSHQQGVLESLWHHDKGGEGNAVHQTLLRGLFSHGGGGGAEAAAGSAIGVEHVAQTTHFERVDGHNVVKLPDGFMLKHHGSQGAHGMILSLERGGHTIQPGEKPGVVLPELHMNEHGFTSDSKTALNHIGITFESHDYPVTHSVHKVESTPVSEYFQHNPKGTVHVERTLWYDNDTPAPVFDKNELRLWWGGENNNGIDSNGNYTFNVAHMSPDGSYHTPFSTNAPQDIREGKMQILLSASGRTQSHPFAFNVDRSGDAHIPKDSDAGRSLFTSRGDQAIFRGRYAEAAQVVGHQGGREQVRLLATYEGKGVENIRHLVTHNEVRHEVVTTLHIPAPEAAPVPAPVDAPIVLPVNWRRELEPVKTIEPSRPQIFAYPGKSLEEMRAWVKENPGSLRSYTKRKQSEEMWVDAEGKPVERSIDRERQTITTYLEGVKSDDPEHAALLERLVSSESMNPMSEKCRVSVTVPAWMEGENLYNFLESYTKQKDRNGKPLDPDLYEINICINRKSGSDADNSVAEVERFIADQRAKGAQFHINYIDVEFDSPFNNVGNARKLITDLTFMRSLSRGRQDGPLYIESEDADITYVNPRVITNAMRKLDENPHLDAVRGMDDRDPGVLMKNDLLFLNKRLWDFAILARSKREYRPENNPTWDHTWNRVYTLGWNTAITAEGLALVGGYDRNLTKGEDMAIGEKLTMIRGDGNMPNLEVVGRVPTRSISSPRRYIYALAKGQNPYGDDFEDPEVNALIRDKSTDELLKMVKPFERINKSNQDAFSNMFTHIYQEALSMLGNDVARAQEYLKDVMSWEGFKRGDYSVDDRGVVQINNWSNIQEILEKYRANPPRWARMTGAAAGPTS